MSTKGGLQTILDRAREDIRVNQSRLNLKRQPANIEHQEARKRDKIDENLHIWINAYIEKQLELKKTLSNRIFWLLLCEIIVAFVLVIMSGFKLIQLEQWLIALIFNVVIFQTFGLVYIIVKNVFPSEDKILQNLADLRGRGK